METTCHNRTHAKKPQVHKHCTRDQTKAKTQTQSRAACHPLTCLKVAGRVGRWPKGKASYPPTLYQSAEGPALFSVPDQASSDHQQVLLADVFLPSLACPAQRGWYTAAAHDARSDRGDAGNGDLPRGARRHHGQGPAPPAIRRPFHRFTLHAGSSGQVARQDVMTRLPQL